MRTPPSAPELATKGSVGWYLTSKTPSSPFVLCELAISCMHDRVWSRSQNRTVQSCDADAIVKPEGSTSSDVTASVCPTSEFVHCPVAMFKCQPYYTKVARGKRSTYRSLSRKV